MWLLKTNRFMCILLGVTFGDHEKIAKNHFGTPFSRPWTPVPPLKFDLLYRAVSLVYNEVTYKSLEFGRNLEGTFWEAKSKIFSVKNPKILKLTPDFRFLRLNRHRKSFSRHHWYQWTRLDKPNRMTPSLILLKCSID